MLAAASRLSALGSAKTSSRIPRGLAKRTAVPAALRTVIGASLSALPRPMMSRRLAATPAGEWRRSVSFATALNSPEARTAAAEERMVGSVLSNTGCGLASGPLAVCVSAAVTARSSV